MKRWNGWGDESATYPLPESAAQYLAAQVGQGVSAPDVTLASVVAAVPPSDLPGHPLINADPVERARHARGQSLPDWIALRSGRVGCFPSGVAYPATEEDVRTLLDFARRTGTRLIPYGGGTSVVGHINPLTNDVLTVDLSRFNQLIHLDEVSRLATFGAGVAGPELEAQLNRLGYTLGHYPQSFELSTLGGWIAARSSGQQSYHYGRIEHLFAGGHVETFGGGWDLPPHPASAAGPDVRQLLLGSEGRLGIITRATVRIQPVPARDVFQGVFFRDWESGIAAVRALAQAHAPLSMMRLSDAPETETTLRLAGRVRLVQWADRGLRVAGFGAERCLLIVGATGQRAEADRALQQAWAVGLAHGGLPTGALVGRMWQKNRFRAPYLRNTLWERGYALDTLETAVPWAEAPATARDIKAAIVDGLREWDERVLVFAHLSHVYADGASIYVTYLFRPCADPDELLARWKKLKSAASRVIVAHGGTISHQHGVGVDHAPYLAAEKGVVGMQLLEAVRQSLDPQGLLNPGKLLTIS